MAAWDVDVAGTNDVVAATAVEMSELVTAGSGLVDASETLASAVTGTVASVLPDVLDARAATVVRLSEYADAVVGSVRSALVAYVGADIAMAATLDDASSRDPSTESFDFGPGRGLVAR